MLTPVLATLSYYKCFKLTALLPVSCALLVASFAARAYSAFHQVDAQVYTASTLLVYIYPYVPMHLIIFLPFKPVQDRLGNDWDLYNQTAPRVGQLPHPRPHLSLRPLL